jgi:hypothetical protein
MTRDSNSVADRVKDKLRLKTRSGFEKFMDFAGENVYLAGGFTGGFFLGIASSWKRESQKKGKTVADSIDCIILFISMWMSEQILKTTTYYVRRKSPWIKQHVTSSA